MKHQGNKKKINYLSPSGFSELQWCVAFAVLLAFLLIGWTSMMGLLGFNVSFYNIVYLHHYFFVWLFDAAMVACLVGMLYISNFRRLNIKVLEDKVNDLNREIDGSIGIAEMIGQGKEMTDTIAVDTELGNTLMTLGKNLYETREKERQFGWVSKGKETISDILRAHNRIGDLAVGTLSGVIDYYGAVQGAFFLLEEDGMLRCLGQRAYGRRRYEDASIPSGVGLIGEAAYEKHIIYRTEIPDDYFTITSGLIGAAKPLSLLIIPLKQEDMVQGVIELSFLEKELPGHYMDLAEEISNIVGATIYNLKVSARTERLLMESQKQEELLQQNAKRMEADQKKLQENSRQMEEDQEKLQKGLQDLRNAQQMQNAMLSNASEFITIFRPQAEVVGKLNALFEEAPDGSPEQERYRELISSLPEPIMGYLPDYDSPSINSILGFPPDQVCHGMDMNFVTAASFSKVEELFRELLKAPGTEGKCQYYYPAKNPKVSKEKLALESFGKNLLHDEAIRGLLFNTRDVTERERANKAEKKRGRMQSLSENSLDVIIRVEKNLKISYVNAVAAKFFQRQASALINVKINKIESDVQPLSDGTEAVPNVFGNFVAFIKDALDDVMYTRETKNAEIEVEIGGEKRIFEVRGIPEFDKDESEKRKRDEVASVLFTAHDVTAIKLLEQEASEQNKKVQDSINYALRIQRALLPTESTFQEHFPKSFMLYRPKMTVSGDFPWGFFELKDQDIYYIAAVDCTGHGVPGALLSIIGSLLLTKIVENDHETTAAETLNRLHEAVRDALKQREGANGRDGMDMALCRIDKTKRELQFAGAHRPMYYLDHEGVFTEYAGSRKGIGGAPLPPGCKPEKPFENHVISYAPGDKFFIFSDGLPDQLGGPDHKKFQTKRVQQILSAKPTAPLSELHHDIVQAFEKDWLHNKEITEPIDPADNSPETEHQVDDILLIDVEFD